jgi:hypothetical protein
LKYLNIDYIDWTNFNTIPAEIAFIRIDNDGSAQYFNGVLTAG